MAAALCLAVNMAIRAALPLDAFTLSWTHSIEKTRWEEDWRVDGDRLRLVAARVQGSGAGMEPPQGAVLSDGSWHWRPALAPIARLRLAVSPYTDDYRLCATKGAQQQCRPLTELAGIDRQPGTIDLLACPARE